MNQETQNKNTSILESFNERMRIFEKSLSSLEIKLLGFDRSKYQKDYFCNWQEHFNDHLLKPVATKEMVMQLAEYCFMGIKDSEEKQTILNAIVDQYSIDQPGLNTSSLLMERAEKSCGMQISERYFTLIDLLIHCVNERLSAYSGSCGNPIIQKEEPKETNRDGSHANIYQVSWAKNAHMNQYPPRPERSGVLLLQCATDFMNKYKTNPCKGWSAEAIATSYWISNPKKNDGFQFAKRLEKDFNIEITPKDVESLDKFQSYVEQTIMRLEKKWIEDNNITPPYEVGVAIHQGRILDINNERGYYYVINWDHPELKTVITNTVKFEDAVPAWY